MSAQPNPAAYGERVLVCRIDELPEVGSAAADVNGRLVALVRTTTTREFFGFTNVSTIGWASVVFASVAALVSQYLLSRHWRDLLRLITGQWRETEPQRGRTG